MPKSKIHHLVPPNAAQPEMPDDAETIRGVPKPVRDDDTEAYLIELGQRVRQMRAIRGMSRKVLASASGVSERYIAQLESGLGNISIMLLRRVAAAIGATIEDLVTDPRRQPRDWPLIRDLMRQATPDMIADVKSVLRGESVKAAIGRRPSHNVVDRIALIGLRGACKSTIGRMTAERLGWPFVELNREIEADTGFSITEIFSLYGQEGFRRFELSALRKIIARPGPMVVATGGGIVAEPITFELLLSAFFTIWVKATPAEHMKRVRDQGDLRPMGNDSGAMAELITILSSREHLYSRARATLDTTGNEISDSVDRLVRLIDSYCDADCPYISGNCDKTNCNKPE